MSLDQAARGRRPARFRQLRTWLWAKKVWFAAGLAVVFMLATAYVVWAVQDLPDPSQGFLAGSPSETPSGSPSAEPSPSEAPIPSPAPSPVPSPAPSAPAPTPAAAPSPEPSP